MENTNVLFAFHHSQDSQKMDKLIDALETCHTQANNFLSQGQVKEAREALAEAFSLLWNNSENFTYHQISNNKHNFGTLTVTLARIYELEGLYQEADQFFHDAINHLLIEGLYQEVNKAYFAYGLALKDRGDYNQAVTYLYLACEPLYL